MSTLLCYQYELDLCMSGYVSHRMRKAFHPKTTSMFSLVTRLFVAAASAGCLP